MSVFINNTIQTRLGPLIVTAGFVKTVRCDE